MIRLGNYFIIAFVSAIIIYAIVYLSLRKRRGKISFIKFLGEFTFVGYLIMLILVTLVMDYDPSVVRESDLIPFRDIMQNIILYNNFIGLKQFNLNIIMFMPVGTLLPIVFNGRKWGVKSVFIVSLIVTFFIEICQYFTGRALDINDIIANSIGGPVGYALYILLFWMSYYIFKRKCKAVLRKENYAIKGTISLIVIAVFFAVAIYTIIIGG